MLISLNLRRHLFLASRGQQGSSQRSRSKRKNARTSRQAPPSLLVADVLEDRVLLSASVAIPSSLVVKPTFRLPDGHVTPVALPNNPIKSAANDTSPYTPIQMETAYGVLSISFAGVAGTGAGETIAIVDAYNDPNIIPDAQKFSTDFGLPNFVTNGSGGGPSLTVLNENGGTALPGNGTPGGWDVEESLDVEWAHSIAPEANIVLYEATSDSYPDMLTAEATAAANPAVSVVSNSWGGGEFSGETALDSTFLTPSGHQGVTFLASTGDSGTPAGYPAFSPNVVAVGGTTLTTNTSGQYVSETPWNDTIYGGADGGGISQYESLPSYQSNIKGSNGASSSYRNVPDVSMDADEYPGVYVLDTYYTSSYFPVGGTSLACPMWAGLIAIANQDRALNNEPTLNGLTQTLPALYSLYGGGTASSYAADFHDVTTGTNGTYSAGKGYDLATGIGTPIANTLVPALAATTIGSPPTIKAPASVSTPENKVVGFSGVNGITVIDPNAGTGANADSLTLSVNDGILTLNMTNGLSFTGGTNGTASLTVMGTVGQFNTALANLTYTPNPQFSGTDSLSISVTDPGNTLSAAVTVPITVKGLISAYPVSIVDFENTPFNFPTSGANVITVVDPSAGSTGVDSLSLTVTNGSLSFGTTTGLTFTSSSMTGPSITVMGTISDLNTALGSLTYTPTTGYTGADSLNILITDPGDNQGSQSAVGIVVETDTPPSIEVPGTQPVTIGEGQSLTFSQLNTIAVRDFVAGTTTADTVTLTVNGGTLALGSTANLSKLTGNMTGSISMTGTVPNIDAALASMVYTPDALFSGPDVLTITASDPLDENINPPYNTPTATVNIEVTPLPQPVVTAPKPVSLNEDSSFQFIGTGETISVQDPEANGNSDTVQLTVSDGSLQLESTSGLSVSSNSSDSSISITGTLTSLNNALDGLIYTPTPGFYGGDSLVIKATDAGTAQSGSATVGITVIQASAPTLNNPPSSATLEENMSLVFSGSTAISIKDSDAGTTGADSLQLSVSDGILTFAGTTTGLTFAPIGSNGSDSMTVSGTVSNLNTALASLTYTPGANFTGGDKLQILVSDPGDGLSTPYTVNLTVLPASNGPKVNAPTNASTNENVALPFTGAVLSVTDSAAGSTVQRMTLTASQGTIQLGSTNGIQFLSGANQTAAMTITGTLTSLNAALNNLDYIPKTNYYGPASLGLSYIDVGDGLTASATVAISVKFSKIPGVAVVSGQSSAPANESGGGSPVSTSPDRPSNPAGGTDQTVGKDNLSINSVSNEQTPSSTTDVATQTASGQAAALDAAILWEGLREALAVLGG